MPDKRPSRKQFTDWIDRTPAMKLAMLPLTHVAKALIADDIISAKRIEPADCKVFGTSLAYFFYGRPAYRFSSGSVIKLEASCPVCFVFDGKLLERAKAIYPFDTGAFNERLYNHVIDEEFDVTDFSLGAAPERVERLIHTVYQSRRDYVVGNRSRLRELDDVTSPHEFAARSYLQLLRSPGRNEPDDRIGTIEVQFGDPVPLDKDLLAVVVPHTLWLETPSPIFSNLSASGVRILTYDFVPGRALEHYHTLLEVIVRDYLVDLGHIR